MKVAKYGIWFLPFWITSLAERFGRGHAHSPSTFPTCNVFLLLHWQRREEEKDEGKKKSKLDIWGVHHSFLLEQESRVFFPSIASTHLWRLWLYISQCLTLYREGLLSRVNGKKKKNSLHSCWIAGCAIANNNMKTNFLKSHKLARTLRSNCSSSIKQRHKWNHGSEELSCFFSSITGDSYLMQHPKSL